MSRHRILIASVIVGLLLLGNFLTPLKVERVSVELRPEVIATVGGFAITNTLVGSWLAMILLIVLAGLTSRKLVDTPSARSLQNVAEAVIEALYGFMERFVGSKARDFFPVVGTFFLFILTSNWLGLLPGFSSIGLWEELEGERVFVPLLRGCTTDLNTTVALAVCSVISSQVYGVRSLGFLAYASRYVGIGKFIAFVRCLARKEKPRFRLLLDGILDMFIGLLKVFEELTKILSFSFRLFGNIFGGEVLLAVMAFLMPYVASIPFMALEIFGGAIQAFIFAVLSTAFFGQATSQHHQGDTQEKEPPAPPDQASIT